MAAGDRAFPPVRIEEIVVTARAETRVGDAFVRDVHLAEGAVSRGPEVHPWLSPGKPAHHVRAVSGCESLSDGFSNGEAARPDARPDDRHRRWSGHRSGRLLDDPSKDASPTSVHKRRVHFARQHYRHTIREQQHRRESAIEEGVNGEPIAWFTD